jgi:tRNA pseudouridine38-40 synthase
VRQAEWSEWRVTSSEAFRVLSSDAERGVNSELETQNSELETQKLFVFEITANAFLYHMVRNIVGTLLRVGRGELSPGDVAAILEAAADGRAAAGPPAPACGLCLMSVEYE